MFHHELPNTYVAEVGLQDLLAQNVLPVHTRRDILGTRITRGDEILVLERVGRGEDGAHDFHKLNVPAHNACGEIGLATKLDRLKWRQLHPVLPTIHTYSEGLGESHGLGADSGV